MRIPLTKYGWPQLIIAPSLVLAAMAVCLWAGTRFLPLWATSAIEAILAGLLIWIFIFFRDPYRPVPADSNLLLAPADGRVTDIELVTENDYIADPAPLNADDLADKAANGENYLTGPAIRIGIFLSIFDPHINRAPCSVKVEKITYKKGRHKNAMSLESGRINESNDLGLLRTEAPNDKLIVRQISGAIARRIVCTCRLGQKLSGGQRFGMIKFGSRTELYVPAREDVKLLVKTGDRVKAGLTPLVKYEIRDQSDGSRATRDE